MPKLTDRETKAAKVETGEKLLADGNGLYLRVRTGDTPKVWLFRFTLSGKTKKMQLGTYPLLSLAAARDEAARLAAMTKRGIDPVEERERETTRRAAAAKAEAAALAAEASRISVADLFERWASIDLIRRKDEGKEVRRMFNKDVLPFIGSMPAEDVRKGHITSITDALLARGTLRMAKVVFSLIRQMFGFAITRDIVESDPTSGIKKSAIGGADIERDRYLNEDEIRLLKTRLDALDTDMSEASRTAIWTILATCCRGGELAQARWEHIDFENRIWRIPPDVAKNEKEHRVFLSDFALRQFEVFRRLSKGSEWVMPARNKSPRGHVCPKSLAKQVADRQRGESEAMSKRTPATSSLLLPRGIWKPHDLRRTGATLMCNMGVLDGVADKCLNHKEPNRMRRIYLRHTHETAMREAWTLLGERLDLLTRADAGNVVTLKRMA